jgi:Domain of unknown function (DUF4915)
LPPGASTEVLVSLCFPRALPGPSATGVHRVSLSAGTVRAVRIDPENSVDWVTGLATDGERVFVLYAARRTFFLAVLFRSTFKLSAVHPLPEVRDGHSLLPLDGSLLVVSSGTDEVIEYQWHNGRPVHCGPVWRAGPERRDTHHLNAIAARDGSVLVCAFGPRGERLWSSAREGYVVDIGNGRRLASDIYHPHSLALRGDRLYWCESHRRRVTGETGQVALTDGYPRGLGWLADDLLCVGTSRGRKVSKSTGLIASPSDPGEPVGSCGLTVMAASTGRALGSISLDHLGSEVYDVLPLPAP